MDYIIWMVFLSVIGAGLGFVAKTLERDDNGNFNWKVMGPWFLCLSLSFFAANLDPSTALLAVGSGAGYGVAKAIDFGQFWRRLRRLKKATGRERVLLLETSEEKEFRVETMATAEARRAHLREILACDTASVGVTELLQSVDQIIERTLPAVLDYIVEQRTASDDCQRVRKDLHSHPSVLPPELLQDADEDTRKFLERTRGGREAVTVLLDFLDKLTTDAYQIRLEDQGNLSELTSELKRVHAITDRVLAAEKTVGTFGAQVPVPTFDVTETSKKRTHRARVASAS